MARDLLEKHQDIGPYYVHRQTAHEHKLQADKLQKELTKRLRGKGSNKRRKISGRSDLDKMSMEDLSQQVDEIGYVSANMPMCLADKSHRELQYSAEDEYAIGHIQATAI